MYLGMPKAWDIAAYTFQADTWCPDCIRQHVLARVNPWQGPLASWSSDIATDGLLKIWAEEIGIDPEDESSYDSGDFPKVVFASSVEDTEHCGQCGQEI